MHKILKYRDWNLLDTNYFPDATVKELFDTLLSGEYEGGEYLKKHHRSIVRRFTFKGKELVVKIPLEKNQRLWIRFTTLFRSGEAFRNVKGMDMLSRRNIPSTVPVMAAESRRFGMVTDSWVVYEYLEGTRCFGKEEYFPEVVDCLRNMHSKNLLHGDSQLQNFLYDGNKVCVIDASPKFSRSTFSQSYEFAYLRKSWPAIESYFGPLAQSFPYRLAKKYLFFQRSLAHFRRGIKRFFGFHPPEG